MHTINLEELRGRHARAVGVSVTAVARVRPEQLGNETPCAAWHLQDLLEHMIAQNHGFAAAARGGHDPAIWTVRPSADPVADYRASADDVLAAFAAEDVFERTLQLPEILPGYGFPAARAIGFHLVDSVVHAWDVARSIGDTITLDAGLAEEALRVALAVPDGRERSAPGAAFAPGLVVPKGASVLDRMLLVLGRAPNWPDAAA
ncbi:TIGR03086 family protein [Nocardia amamiensis]|uniref:TIGR03086 family protein n=1 Tax=Nocardia amamiensis TaxID=404578 RepID=A0ABS0CPU2_9NOCA|nr:TIGR03086 family metal-binding protein [Nocardia amamiensis]MBF6298581.1 TIGR03086 family protein [Nocardia amamiensis]